MKTPAPPARPPRARRRKKTPPKASRPIHVLTLEELKKLLGACSRKASTGLRNRALLALGYGAGLRVSEALALRVEDLDLDAGTVRVRVQKGGGERLIGIGQGSMAIVERWLDRRRRRRIPAKAPLLCTLAGGALLPSYVRTLLPRLAREAGVNKRAHFHGLRHTRAVHLIRRGVPINEVQAQLGHLRLDTTARYLRHVTAEDLAVAANRVDLEADDGRPCSGRVRVALRSST